MCRFLNTCMCMIVSNLQDAAYLLVYGIEILQHVANLRPVRSFRCSTELQTVWTQYLIHPTWVAFNLLALAYAGRACLKLGSITISSSLKFHSCLCKPMLGRTFHQNAVLAHRTVPHCLWQERHEKCRHGANQWLRMFTSYSISKSS